MESSDKMWSTGEENGKRLQFSCLENPMNNMKRQKDMTLEYEPLTSEGVQYASGEEWRAVSNSSRKNEAAGPKQKGHSAVKCLVVKVKFYFLRTILHRNLEC